MVWRQQLHHFELHSKESFCLPLKVSLLFWINSISRPPAQSLSNWHKNWTMPFPLPIFLHLLGIQSNCWIWATLQSGCKSLCCNTLKHSPWSARCSTKSWSYSYTTAKYSTRSYMLDHQEPFYTELSVMCKMPRVQGKIFYLTRLVSSSFNQRDL